MRDIHVFLSSQLCPRRQKDPQSGEPQCKVSKPCRDCKISLHWQSNGEYLAAKLCRRKTKNKVQTTFHIVRLEPSKKSETKESKRSQKNDIPVEVLDIEDSVIYFAWEPNAKRFGVIYGDGQRNTVQFYEIKSNKLKVLGQLPDRVANCIFWSPIGNIVILAGLGALSGFLEWYDVTAKETCASLQHFMCTDVEWDPSGRYVITAVTQPLRQETFYRYNSENGYKLWTLHGQNLSTVRLDFCYQVNWRPRPPRLLTDEQEKAIQRKVLKGKDGKENKEYWERFAKEDEEIESLTQDDYTRTRKKMELEWKKYREEAKKASEEEAAERAELEPEENEDFEDMEEVFEEELDLQQEVIGENKYDGVLKK